MKKFSDWFFENLKVMRYPMPGELRVLFGETHVINVSDEYIPACHTECLNNTRASKERIYYHWFPLNECVGQMGINSIFAAMVVLHEAELKNANVLLHCHAGVNRSAMIREAYYFMRTGKHLREFYLHEGILMNFHDANKSTTEKVTEDSREKPNMLLNNIRQGLLPSAVLMEKFLKVLGTRLEETMDLAASRGGLLTQLKTDIGLQ